MMSSLDNVLFPCRHSLKGDSFSLESLVRIGDIGNHTNAAQNGKGTSDNAICYTCHHVATALRVRMKGGNTRQANMNCENTTVRKWLSSLRLSRAHLTLGTCSDGTQGSTYRSHLLDTNGQVQIRRFLFNPQQLRCC